jgi:hypothetical protein
MTILEQGARAGDFLLSEAKGERSREQVDLLALTGPAAAGTVIVLDGAGYKLYESPETPAAITQPLAILFNNKPASEDVQPAAAIVRDAEVDGDLLFGLDDAVLTALAGQGVIVR